VRRRYTNRLPLPFMVDSTFVQELTEKLEEMRFRLQLKSINDQRSSIPRQQDTLRRLLQRARQLQRELYRLDRSRDEDDDADIDDDDDGLLAKLQQLQQSLDDTKKQVSVIIVVVTVSVLVRCCNWQWRLCEFHSRLSHLTTMSLEKLFTRPSSVTRQYNLVSAKAKPSF